MSRILAQQSGVIEERSTTVVPCEGGDGCLLQILPLELDGGMRRIGAGPYVIGREPDADLCIRDPSISRQHARIERTPVGYVISDLQSTNGVYINEREVRTSLLSPGDCIRMGNRIFKFLLSDHIELQYHEAVYAMMTRDSLTGVWNKRYLLDVLERELKRSRRCRAVVHLALFDIDHFKSINDTYGHLVGDEVLTELGRRVSSVLRGDDILARYGGDEFAVVLSDAAPEEAMDTAERCRAVVNDGQFPTAAGQLTITISLGLACAEMRETMSALDIIKAADELLYRAKRGGRNRVSTAGRR